MYNEIYSSNSLSQEYKVGFILENILDNSQCKWIKTENILKDVENNNSKSQHQPI